jgi:hypothetical protein
VKRINEKESPLQNQLAKEYAIDGKTYSKECITKLLKPFLGKYTPTVIISCGRKMLALIMQKTNDCRL